MSTHESPVKQSIDWTGNDQQADQVISLHDSLTEEGDYIDSSDKTDTSRMVPPLTAGEKPMPPCLWRLMIIFMVLIYGSYTILVHLCEVDGALPFSSASVVLVTELMKFVISIVMYLPEYREKGLELPGWRSALPYSVPAILYWINNNTAVHMQLQMDPATYQVLGNMKILSTAFLYRLIIKRPITGVQWVALCLLLLAGICNSYGGLMAKTGEHSAGVIHITILGLAMISMYCFISGLAGVYSEYILKGKYEMSLHIQNGLLYSFGIILNSSSWVYTEVTTSKGGVISLFEGYTIYTWILIISQAFCGLIMSAVMKHANNIVRLFIISCAMLVTMTFSIAIFHLKLNVYICASFLLVFIALGLYHKK